MNKLIDFQELEDHCKNVQLQEAIDELHRVIKAYQRLYSNAVSQHPTKADTFRQQYRRLAALKTMLTTMTEKEWQRRMLAGFGQGVLFG